MASHNQETRTSGASSKLSKTDGPGPFEAIIKNHLDGEYMGRLEVELLKSNTEGSTPNVGGERVIVDYLSPFYGVTPFAGSSPNDNFASSQKSYGMWAIPPDVGTKVLVIFAEGNKSRGFWIGCIQDRYMNFMVPGNASTKYNTQDQTTQKPVGEYNKRTEEAVENDPTKFLKPVNTDALTQLTNAGIQLDQIRGTTTSSARRETPSSVFGWSTPGPLDRRPGHPTTKTGEKGAEIDIPSSRLTGTTFVMDDGDTSLYRKGPAGGENAVPSEYTTLDKGGDPSIPANELFRIRTRTGHQILLHNSEDLIYIAHGSGKSWIEMTANGKIDIYAEDSISMHTKNDFNFKADRDINIEAGNNINLKAGNQMMTQTGANWEVKVGADGKLTCAGSSNIKSAAHKETADRIDMNGPPAAEAGSAPVPTRVPAAGSWTGSENKNPAEHTPAKTNTDPQAIAAGTANSSSDDKAKDKPNEDTFAKCPPAEKSEETKKQEERQTSTEETAASENATLTSDLDAFGGPGENINTSNVENANVDPGLDAFGGAGEVVSDPREIAGTATLVNDIGTTDDFLINQNQDEIEFDIELNEGTT
jgi:hypothetical protein